MTHNVLIIHRLAGILLFLVITTGVARGQSGSESPTQAPGCVVFLGGTGTRTGNADFDQRWITVNETVSKAAIQKLTELHYRIEPMFTRARGSQESFAELYRVMQQKQCDQVLQLSHELTIASTPGSVPHLNFKVLVFHLERKVGEQSAKAVSEYEGSYPFELTKEVLQNLSMSAVGIGIATDIDKARVLAARGP